MHWLWLGFAGSGWSGAGLCWPGLVRVLAFAGLDWSGTSVLDRSGRAPAGVGLAWAGSGWRWIGLKLCAPVLAVADLGWSGCWPSLAWTSLGLASWAGLGWLRLALDWPGLADGPPPSSHLQTFELYTATM